MKIGDSRVAPLAMSLRRGNVHRLINPPPYYAVSYGEKVYLDQNEKLARFGVTYNILISNEQLHYVRWAIIRIRGTRVQKFKARVQD